ncbi:MAG: SH3 domain-containing protein [Oscillospiraceae bacterium]|nr:SH3 domain-containing protein [Oscillospiraceae bacterium]
MSDSNLARRTDLQVFFAGTDISEAVNKDLSSFTYTDNEEDETDDLQIKLNDRSGKWLTKWLDTAINAAAEGGKTLDTKPTSSDGQKKDKTAKYKVIATGGANIRSSPGEMYSIRGTLSYGTIIEVIDVTNGWAYFTYSGKHAYVAVKCLQFVSGGSASTSGSSQSVTTSSSVTWNIGDEVIVNGRPQYSSYGTGTPGANVTNYKGKITHLNLKSNIPYPIHVDYLGWFAESQVEKVNGGAASTEQAGSKGLKISAVIVRRNWNSDGKDDVLDCGQFELDSVDVSGPPATLTIKGTSLPYSSTIRQTLKSKSWENISLSGICQQIAGRNGMTCMFESRNNPKYTRVEQYQTSDIAFLKTLCHNAGCSLKVTNNILVIFDQEEYESKATVRTIKFGEKGGYTKYKLSTGANDQYASCRVSYTNASGNVISATAYVEDYKDGEDNQCLEVHQKVESIAEAQALAHKLLRLHNKYEFEASFTFPGDTTLVAGNAVMLEGFGAWNGKYMIKQSKHSISSSGYTTQISLRKALPANEAVNSSSTATSADIDELARQCIRGDWGNGEERKRRLTEAGYDYKTVQKRVNEMLGM